MAGKEWSSSFWLDREVATRHRTKNLHITKILHRNMGFVKWMLKNSSVYKSVKCICLVQDRDKCRSLAGLGEGDVFL